MRSKPKYYVYKTEHRETSEYYFGRCKCRTKEPITDGYFGSGNWVKSIEDKSLLSKVIIAEFDNIEDASAVELALINDCISDALCMNLKKASSGGMSGKTHTEEVKSKMSDNRSGENNSRFGKTHTEETKAKQSASHIGKTLSKETKSKISAANIGKTLSKETKSKISAANIGKILSEETKTKQSTAKSGENNSSAKLTELDVILIRELYATGEYTQQELADRSGIK